MPKYADIKAPKVSSIKTSRTRTTTILILTVSSPGLEVKKRAHRNWDRKKTTPATEVT